MKQKLLNSFKLRAVMLVAILCAGFASAWADDVTDVITASNLAATGTTYTDFSNVSKTSSAVYAGNSAKDNSENIQMRSKNSNSGIVSTVSGGTVKSVTITVGSGSNTIDVYGSNTAYTAASDLYNTKQGTKIGSVSETGTITFDDDYAYVGIRSNNGAIYLSSIEIVWETSGGGGTPTPSTYTVTYDANGGTGTMTDSNSPYEEDVEVTLLPNTFTAPDGKVWNSWTVKDASNNDITVSNDKFTMPASNVIVSAQWVDDPNAPQYEWVETSLADLTSSDVFVIVGNNGNNYALSAANGTSSAPAASAVTIADGKINTAVTTVTDALKWNIGGDATNGYTFYPNGSSTTYIYCTNTNNGVRVGKPNANTTEIHAFTVTNGYLTVGFSTPRYIGIYNSSDWRCYTSTDGNIANQTFKFYKRQVASTDPSISASDPEMLAYNATSGSFNFTISNPVDGASTSVSENVDWISNATVSGNNVTFTTTANEAHEARTATVTLTYTYNTNETVTKDVTITQAAAPVIYTTIQELFDAATSTEADVNVTFNNWVVSGVSTNGKNVFVTDNAGNGFVIYSSVDISSTYPVGSILSGTAVTCKLKKYNGFAEMLNLNASDLTITEGGTVTASNITLADLAGVNTGALVSYQSLTCSIDNNKYYLTDGTTTIQVYNALFAFDALEAGKTYNITGVYQQYNSTKEILPRSSDDIEEVVSTEPSITVAETSINVSATDDNGTIGIDYANLTISDMSDFDIQFYDAQGNELNQGSEPDWIEVLVAEQDPQVGEGYVVSYTIDENTDTEERSAYFKVFAIGDQDYVYSDLITITQAAPLSGDQYVLYTGDLVEGDYIIYYDGKAMKSTISSNRLGYEEVTPVNDVITTDEATIVWHIEPSGEYWLVRNNDGGYAAGTGTKNQAQLINDFEDDKALWTISGTETYDFVNKANAAANVNAHLRNNGTYGFACYAEGTGGALSLYKLVPTWETVTVSEIGYGTYASDHALDFEGSNIKAFYATLEGSTLTFHEISKVPAKTGVLLYANGGENVDILFAEESEVEPVTGNVFVRGTGASVTWADNDQKYVLFNGIDGIGFYKANNNPIATNRAYVQVPAGTQVKSFAINLDDTDAIGAIKPVNDNTDIFNLAGQRVNKAQKGVYIVNGKKVLVK